MLTYDISISKTQKQAVIGTNCLSELVKIFPKKPKKHFNIERKRVNIDVSYSRTSKAIGKKTHSGKQKDRKKWTVQGVKSERKRVRRLLSLVLSIIGLTRRARKNLSLLAPHSQGPLKIKGVNTTRKCG